MASYYRRDAAALAPLLRPVATPADADALFEGLGGSGPAVAAACQLVSQQRGEGFSLPALFEGIGRWALAALGPDAPPAEQPWVPGSGPQARAFSAAECRGVLANILLLNVEDPVGERDFKPPSKNGGLRLDRRMLSCDAVGTHKLACLLHYFAAGLEAEGTEDDSREVRFERRVGVAQPLPGFRSSAGHAGAEFPVALHDAAMEAIPDATAFVNFANAIFGYGEFIASCTQEEILQVCCPEFNVGMLFQGTMRDEEVMVVHGCRRYSAYSGYLHSFRCTGAWTSAPAVQSILTIDAVVRQHFSEAAVLRDVQKAALAFAGQPVVSTGRWGCGVFGGTPAHKFVQQLVAAMLSGSQIHFSTFGTPDGCDEVLAGLAEIAAAEGEAHAGSEALFVAEWMVAPGRLLQALLDCCSDAPGAAAAAAQADAALSPAQREVRRLLAEATELEAENPARAAEVYAAAYKLEPDFAERELYGDPQLQAKQQQQFVARFLAAVRANA